MDLITADTEGTFGRELGFFLEGMGKQKKPCSNATEPQVFLLVCGEVLSLLGILPIVLLDLGGWCY